MPRAKAAALEALERDANLAEAHTTLAHVGAFYDWEWETAEERFRRAIEVNPKYPMSYHWYALYLAAMGRHDEALSAEKEAQKRDPLSLIINKNVGTILYYARRYDEAIEQYSKTLELDPVFVRTHFYLGIAYEQQGLFAEAIAELEKAARLSERDTVCLAALGRAYAGSGQRDRAQQILARLRGRSKQRYIPSLSLAVVELALGENDRAFDLLDKAYEERSSWLVSLKIDPWFDGIRTDPRYMDLVQRVGLEA